MSAPLIDLQATVNAVLDAHPNTHPVFAAFGIDTCCGGAKSLHEVAHCHRLNVAELVAALEAALDQTARST